MAAPKLKVIVPLAGKGTRLLPLTQRVPKPLVHVAGRPVMDYVMDGLKGLDVAELIVITGHLKDTVERYIRDTYDVPARFVEQRTRISITSRNSTIATVITTAIA